MTQTAKTYKNKEYPKYSSARSALEHFRLIGTLFKYDGIPASYLQHIKNEIARFDRVKEQSKQTAINLKNVKDKLGDLIKRAVINHIDDESFGLENNKDIQELKLTTSYKQVQRSKDCITTYDVMEIETETLLYYDIHYEIFTDPKHNGWLNKS